MVAIRLFLGSVVCSFLGAWLLQAEAEDWPQWGGRNERNMVSRERNLPISFVPGRKKPDGSGVDSRTTQNVLWTVKLGTDTYTSPAVAGGKVFICTNDLSVEDPRYSPTGGGLLMCVDAASGQLRWRLPVPRLVGMRQFRKYSNMIHTLGICSSPTVDGNRVYVITNRGEVMCLDVNGLANGNEGSYREESRYLPGSGGSPVALRPTDPDILWRFDMLSQLKIFPHDANSSSILVEGDVLYAGTANGVDNHGTPCPDAPSLIALDKWTGRLVGYDDAKIGRRLEHGQWSSPSLGRVNGRTLIFYGGGDGVCYAFEALRQTSDKPVTLKCVWTCDCNPPEYRTQNGKPIDYWSGDARDTDSANKNDGRFVGPSEIIATPVCVNNRVYVAIGQDPEHGRGKGMLNCIDATLSGDITRTGKIWCYDKIQRSLCTAAVIDGLVYVADVAGTLHCLDAENGQCYWTHDTKQEVWTSLLVADGKVYLGTQRALWVLSAGKGLQVLSQVRLGSPIWSPPVAANSVLYVASQRYLWAVQAKANLPLALHFPPDGSQ